MSARGYVEPTQADRDAAALLFDRTSWPSWDSAKHPHTGAAQHMIDGKGDGSPYVQILARHRIAHTDAQVLIQKGMRLSALICGDLAETIYNDGDEFKAATGCESAIMKAAAEYRAAPECAPLTDAHTDTQRVAELEAALESIALHPHVSRLDAAENQYEMEMIARKALARAGVTS
jgi:hypothetical protein